MNEHKMVPMPCAKRIGVVCKIDSCPAGFRHNNGVCCPALNSGWMSYYEPCHGERPGEVDIEAKNEGMQLAVELGLGWQTKEGGGYYMYGEESKLRDLLSRWYEEDEIDKILDQGTTDYED